MNIKNIFSSSVKVLLAGLLIGCQAEEIKYSGENYVMFSKKDYYFPSTPDTSKAYSIHVSTTNIADVDRTYAVEIDAKSSTAIKGLHYNLLDHNVTIKAGELSGQVKVKPNFHELNSEENLSFKLRLLADSDEKWDLYGDTTKVELIKCPDFDIKKFVPNMKISASFPFSEYTTYYVKTEIKNDSTLIVKEPFVAGFDLELTFKKNDINPFEQGVVVYPQVAFPDLSYGKVHTNTVGSNQSYYVTEVGGVALYLDMYVPKVGSFGIHPYLLMWVTQAEVDAANNEIPTPMMLKGIDNN